MRRRRQEDPRLAVVDVETTGFSRYDRIVEFACVTVVDGAVVEEYETLIQPERDPGPVHIHGITPEMLQAAPPFETVAGDISSRLDGAVLVAHNISFDVRMLRQEAARLGARNSTRARGCAPTGSPNRNWRSPRPRQACRLRTTPLSPTPARSPRSWTSTLRGAPCETCRWPRGHRRTKAPG